VHPRRPRMNPSCDGRPRGLVAGPYTPPLRPAVRSPMESTQRKRDAKILRVLRKIHLTMGAILFSFFLVVSLTGLLLGWKKHTGGVILPKSHVGVSTDPADWLPIDVLHAKAVKVAREQISPDLSLDLERIDIRPDKGML